MRFLSLAEVLVLQQRLIATSGGADGLRDAGALESAVSQPHASFAGEDLYPDLIAKAAALGHALVMNHPFLDGNKRLGHAAMETFLVLNGREIACELDEQERMMLTLAAGGSAPVYRTSEGFSILDSLAVRHCNGEQNTRLHQYGCQAFLKMTALF